MSDEKKERATYDVGIAINSAVGHFAQVINNNFPPQVTATDAGAAELRRLFEQVNERLDALDAADRVLLAPAVEQTVQAVAEIQQGDESPEKESFLATRLRHIYNMSNDIGEVIITTLATPAAGVVLALKKIAQKAKADLNL